MADKAGSPDDFEGLKLWATANLRTFDVETFIDRMEDFRDAALDTQRAFLAYIDADVQASRRLLEMHKAQYRRRAESIVVANRQDGLRIYGMWLDELHDWELDFLGSTVVVNGIEIPRIIPMGNQIEPPKFDIREYRTRQRRMATFGVDTFRRLIDVEVADREVYGRRVVEPSTQKFNPPATEQRRRRDGAQGKDRYGFQDTSRSGRRSRR